MRKTRTRPSVWVPFEILPKGERKCDDLPRFRTNLEVRDFIAAHQGRLRGRLLQWREHFEREYIEEYEAGIGTLRILLL